MIEAEKAKELFDKMGGFRISYAHRIKCAKVAVENEYTSNRELLINLRSCGVIENENTYLTRLQRLIDEEANVKFELDKLGKKK